MEHFLGGSNLQPLPSYIINHHSPQSKSSVILLAEGMLIWVKHSGAPENLNRSMD